MKEPVGGWAVWHVASHWDATLGQLCSRCGYVLDDGLENKAWPVGTEPAHGWPDGERVLVFGTFPVCTMTESVMKADRDRSDEIECDDRLCT